MSKPQPDLLLTWLADEPAHTGGGGVNGVYILRTVSTSDFNPTNGQQKLAGLDARLFGEQSTIITAVAEALDDDGKIGETDTTKQSKYMRLSTFVNLDSRLSVSWPFHMRQLWFSSADIHTDWLHRCSAE